MRWKIQLICLLAFTMYGACNTWAQPELQRPVASSIEQNALELWTQFDYFSPSLDLTNYAKKASTTSSLDRYAVETLGIHYGISRNFNIRYVFSLSQQKASRSTEPKQINTDSYSHDLRLQYMLHQEPGLRIAAEAGYLTQRAKPIDFYTFQIGGFTFRRVGSPFATLTASDHAWLAALRSNWKLDHHIHLHLSAEVRKYRVLAQMLSNDALINAFLKPPLTPQRTPWNETHLLIQAGLDWQLSQVFSVAADYAHTNISRSGYQPVAGKTDYTSQDQLDGYLFWEFAKGWNIYGHGRLNRHFILGDLPMTYNQRSSHLFKNPFGMISIGLSWSM